MKKITIFLFLFASIFVNAQQFTLSGRVVNENKKPLAGASIYVKEIKKGTTSDSNGNFRVALKKGNYTIEVSFLGYKTISEKIALSKDENYLIQLKAEFAVLDEILVSAVRVKKNDPVTHSNISKKELVKRNLGQDIPTLLNYMPSVVTTSDAGNGIGYSSLRVRGSDATRINVTINGIAYNDSESQGTFWVNLGDFTSSVENIQLQRGVGTSTNGAGAFGASLNLLTEGVFKTQSAEIATSVGSFNTLKNTVKFNSGLLNEHIEFSGRFSKISSNGYLDRASADLKSYFIQANYISENTLIKALVFGGEEVTYQAWNGVDATTAKNDRTFNSTGIIYNNDFSIRGFYDNQVDHYKQDHAQLHWNQKYDKNLSTNVAFHYTRGRGYFEEYNQAWGNNGNPVDIVNQSLGNADNITRRYANSHFYGTTFSLNYKNEELDLIFGGAYNKHNGRHFGETIWNRFAGNTEIRDIYYDRFGNKTDGNIFVKGTYKLSEKLNVFVDLQQRRVTYNAEIRNSPNVDEVFNFFNPKAGFSFNMNKANNFYISYSKAHREPTRADYRGIPNATNFPRPEELNDFELGWRYTSKNVKVNSNIYYMSYIDQLVLTGEIDLNGAFRKTNSGSSNRLGLEVDATFRINDYFDIRPNFTLSRNQNNDFLKDDNGTITNVGNTNISFSPAVIFGNLIVIKPIENLDITFLSKFVGEQFLTNLEEQDKKLENYFVNDLNINYVIQPKSIFKEVIFTALINNIFSEEYISNGYFDPDWGTYFYPQATRNFLAGVTLRF